MAGIPRRTRTYWRISRISRGNSRSAHLFVTDVLGREGDRALHTDDRQDLQQVFDGWSAIELSFRKWGILTVLHDITNDTEIIEVTSTSLGSEGLLEGDLNVVDVVTVPGGAEELVTKSEDEQVLYHLLSEVVVDTEDLLLSPIGLERLLKVPGALKVASERLLNLCGGLA
jgi:hypothetical protein